MKGMDVQVGYGTALTKGRTRDAIVVPTIACYRAKSVLQYNLHFESWHCKVRD